SVSCTTRPKRPSEQEGVHYFFVDRKDFEKRIEDGEFLEYARVFDHHYGTPKGPVEEALASGKDVLFDIDWQGTQQLAENARDDLVAVFILPPSLGELERRLKERKQDSAEVVARRMARANEEVSHFAEYDYVVVNDDIEQCVDQLHAILQAERAKRERQTGLSAYVNQLRNN
ncbi:MAG: guanylate kinase, partial [Alphaproteobacteria bacterium]|nr:guanylate kinase [Alphaproteobacteria bacterium]